jgi:hypothetical protein
MSRRGDCILSRTATVFAFCTTLVLFGLGKSALADPKFIQIDPPGSFDSGAFPNSLNNRGDLVGHYFDNQIHVHGFLRTKRGDISDVGTTGYQPRALNIEKMVTGTSGISGFVTDAAGTITLFDAPGTDGTGLGTLPIAIDKAGNVAGLWATSHPPTHAFLRDSHGNFTSFDGPHIGTGQDQGTFVQAMSQKGDIAGFYTDQKNHNHGFVRSARGRFKIIDARGAHVSSGGTKIYAINADGSVAGVYNGDFSGHGFLIDADKNQFEFDIPNGSQLRVTGINLHNDVAGYYEDRSTGAFLSFIRSGTSGELTFFDAPIADDGTFAQSINDEGEVAGFFIAQSQGHVFLRKP